MQISVIVRTINIAIGYLAADSVSSGNSNNISHRQPGLFCRQRHHSYWNSRPWRARFPVSWEHRLLSLQQV
jgi:hypothetical protein